MRVFIIYDDLGNVVSASQFEELHEGLGQPFHLDNPKHSIVELDSDDEGFKAVAADRSQNKKNGLLKVHSDFKVENKKGGGKGLIKKAGRTPVVDTTPAPGPAPGPAPVPPKKPAPGETPPTRPPGPADDFEEA
jgi:hypothetical protein